MEFINIKTCIIRLRNLIMHVFIKVLSYKLHDSTKIKDHSKSIADSILIFAGKLASCLFFCTAIQVYLHSGRQIESIDRVQILHRPQTQSVSILHSAEQPEKKVCSIRCIVYQIRDVFSKQLRLPKKPL